MPFDCILVCISSVSRAIFHLTESHRISPLAMLATRSLQAACVWYWRNRANKNYSPGVMGVGAQGTFSPWPKFLVWPSPLLFVLLMFVKGARSSSWP